MEIDRTVEIVVLTATFLYNYTSQTISYSVIVHSKIVNENMIDLKKRLFS